MSSNETTRIWTRRPGAPTASRGHRTSPSCQDTITSRAVAGRAAHVRYREVIPCLIPCPTTHHRIPALLRRR